MKTLTEAVKACGGVWPSDSLEGVGVGWNGKSTDREPDFIQLGIGGPEFTRPEFEAEAARLSGKPGWGEAPEWAQWLAQCDDGHWEWYEKKPTPHHVYWSHCPFKGELAFKGTVIGDWRDTLERRPEVVADAVVSGFDDSGLPTEGTECEYRIGGGDTPWYSCKVLYVLRGNDDPDADGWRAVVWCPHLEKDQLAFLPRFEFRPLKSDRDRWVDRAEKILSKCSDDETMRYRIAFIYDLIQSGELPTPEPK